MPKIFERDGFVIYVYFDERAGRHHLPHIHVYRGRFGGDSLVVQIPELAILHSDMMASNKKAAMQIIEENLTEILEKASQF